MDLLTDMAQTGGGPIPDSPKLVIFSTFFTRLAPRFLFFQFSLSTRSAAIYGLLNGAKSVARTMVSIKLYIVTFKATAGEMAERPSVLNACAEISP